MHDLSILIVTYTNCHSRAICYLYNSPKHVVVIRNDSDVGSAKESHVPGTVANIYPILPALDFANANTCRHPREQRRFCRKQFSYMVRDIGQFSIEAIFQSNQVRWGIVAYDRSIKVTLGCSLPCEQGLSRVWSF